jgi:hypothetical protein
MLYRSMRLRLKKRTSINSKDSQLHKEKEMADFRKWFLAFAVLALVTSLAVPAAAQVNTPALQCVANAGVPPTVRAEGLTELVGDLVLNCNGGTPTLAGQLVPQANVTIFLSTNITSRITSNPYTEALLLIDEPHKSGVTAAVPLQACDPTNGNLGVCAIQGSPTSNGVGTYNPTVGGNLVNPNGTATASNVTRPNVFQGRLTGVNQVTFFGVPIDAPGTNTTRIIRITNIRGNANQLGVSSTLVPTQITAFISITGSTSVPVNNPQQTVAFVQRGLVGSVRFAYSFIQCVSANPDIATNPANALNSGGQNAQQFSVRIDEGFGTAFKVKNIQTQLSNAPSSPGTFGSLSYPPDAAQDNPGAVYNTESGFLANNVAPSPINDLLVPNGTFNGVTRGMSIAGIANQGTRLLLAFNSVATGAQLFVPVRVAITNQLGGGVTGVAVLTSTDANGNGGFSPASGNSSGLSAVSLVNGSGVAVYEVLYSDPFQVERVTVPVAVAFVANVGNNLPAPGVQSTLGVSFAPISNVGTASETAPIPRFAPSATPLNSFIVNKCSCNLLFPFVSNQQGYDTGVAIANTSVDPFGTTPQQGTVTLNYYSGGTPPPAQTTNAPVPGGQQLLFTLSGGGNFGIAATPGFQGYIIAQAQFQYCHAFAYISAQGALPTSPGASIGYLGLVMDAGGLIRTGQVSEVLAH